MDQVFDFIMNKTKEVPVPDHGEEKVDMLDFITTESRVIDFNSFVKIHEQRDIDDPRNNQPEDTIKSVLDIWDNSDPDQTTNELIKQYEDGGFSIKTLHEISKEEDIPDNSVIFTYHSDPSDESYYKQGPKIIPINMGRLTNEVLDTKDRGFYKAEDGSLGIIGFGLIWIVVSPEEDRLAVIGYTVVLSGLASLIAWAIHSDKNDEN